MPAPLPPIETRFKPGESGNPAGRPLGSRNRSSLVRDLLEAKLDANNDYAQAMTKAVIEKALSGDVPAFKELLDSAYGKVTDKVESTGKDGQPLFPSSIAVNVVKPKCEEDLAAEH